MTIRHVPVVWIDAFAEETAARIVVVNQDPQIDVTDVLVGEAIRFHVLDLGPGVNVPSLVRVWVLGVLAYDSGIGFFPPYHMGSSVFKSPSIGSAVNDVWAFRLEHGTWPWSSEEVVDVRVYAQSSAGYDIDITWEFTAADVIKPTVQEVVAAGPRRIDVLFSEGMDASSIVASAFTISSNDPPYYLPTIEEVVQQTSSRYSLVLEQELSNARAYSLHVEGVQDDAVIPNVIDPVDVAFTSAPYWTDARRKWRLWDWVPGRVRWADRVLTGHSPGHTEQFISVLQEVVDLWLLDVDDDAWITSGDKAPEGAIDLLLAFLYNPFSFVLTELQKRKLLRMLPTINASKHGQGIVDVVWFFLGIAVTIVPVATGGIGIWRLASSTLPPALSGPYGRLGISTRLGYAPGTRAPYTFNVIVPVALTDEQRSKMIAIVEAMKAAHEHYYLIEPPSASHPEWLLGIAGRGELGVVTYLGF